MTDLTIKIPGFQIACKTWGDPDSPVMLALHGWLDNANSFKPIAPYLSQDYYLIAMDLPGHGLSSHMPEGCHYHFIDAIFAIFAAMDTLGHERVNLLGHSMGACLASLMAGVAPERIHKMALIEGLGPFSASAESCQEQLSRYLHHHDIYANKASNPYPSLGDAAKARANRGHISIELAKILCQRGVVMTKGQYYWCHDRRLVTPTPLYLTEEQILDCISKIKAPTHLIWAEDGFEYPQDIMEKRIAAVSHAQQYRLPGGHHLHMEHPEAVAEFILSL